MLTAEKISAHLSEPITVSVFETLESTNRTAKEFAADKCERLIIARSQSGGRGRLGRSFFSPSGGLYMSLLLYPKYDIADISMITTAAAVAVSRATERIAEVECKIKWVNDIYVNDKKVCGILTEGQFRSDGALDYAILGIGVNLLSPTGGFPEDIANRAGAVFDEPPADADNILAAAIVNEFMELYRTRLDKRMFLDEYRSRSCVIGCEVDVVRIVGGTATHAVATGIDDGCRLVVRYDDGTTEALESGDVTIRGI